MASGGGKILGAEERRRQKELEEARKAGLAAPEVRHCSNVCPRYTYHYEYLVNK